MIASRTRPVVRRISSAATRPPSSDGTSRCEMTPRSDAESIARTWRCWWGGKKSMTRLIVSGASAVCSVESTRWPVSAAERAVRTVSSSRISPMRMMSGSWRRTRRSARPNEPVSDPTSRWLMTERLSACRNSIGSSMVTMWRAAVVLTWSTMAASVVDFPEPVVPVTSTIPRGSSAMSRTASGRPSSAIVRDAVRDAPADDRDRATLAEGVDTEASQARHGIREVSLPLGLHLLERGWGRGASRAPPAPCRQG